MEILTGLGIALLAVVGIIILLLVMITLDTGAWWKDLKGFTRKQKVIAFTLLIVVWLALGLFIGTIDIS
ncbi:hypothetical protein GCM10010954_21330 [Halobacillus andaensis]|uniref:Uncharacterized protein n=1 Tax=Halobacillus andaensis TaxID=1176239 RepID=A0A917B760_HALAA|nr:hypothetical protein [Halobacillus andaensis]MBP2004360.1 hypothetical protein [Halobacillus andaensis]GGF22235.1 hypothetical protein GCM10010954_21330 [Halobacillus andaensis]